MFCKTESGVGGCWLKPKRSGFSLNRIISALGIEKVHIDVGIKKSIPNCR